MKSCNKNLFYLFLIFGIFVSYQTVFAVAPTITNVTVNGITKSAGRIVTSWNTQPSTMKILYGTSTSYGEYVNVGNPSQDNLLNWHWYITGIAPSTTIHFCPQGFDSSGNASVCDGVSNNYTFTTLSDSTPGPDEPIAPQVTVDTTPPTQTGNTLNVLADCSNFQSQINASSPGDTILIPKGTVCTGKYIFPNKTTSSKWIVIKSDGNLPISGNRATPADVREMATIRTNNPWIPFISAPELLTGRCTPGELRQIYPASNKPGLYGCNFNNSYTSSVYEQISYTSGTSVPNSCAIGTLFYKTNEPDSNLRTWMCTNDRGVQRFVQIDVSYEGLTGKTAPIQIASNADRYRFEGIEITYVEAPATWSGNIDPGLQFRSLVYHPSDSTVTDIIYDRVYAHGYVYPSMSQFGFEFHGSRNAIINSTISDLSRGIPLSLSEYLDIECFGIFMHDNAVGGLVRNNALIDIYGITMFASDEQTTNVATDFVVQGNYFYRSPSYKYPGVGGQFYFMRHALELKRGQRWLITGNIFDGNYVTINQAALLAINSRHGYGHTLNNTAQVSDINITNNIFRNAPVGIFNLAFDTYAGGQLIITQRIAMRNNLFYRIKSGSEYVSIPGGYGGGYIFLAFDGTEDMIYEHNTSYDVSEGTFFSYYNGNIAETGLRGSGVNFRGINNIMETSAGTTLLRFDGLLGGTQALDESWGLYPLASTVQKGWKFDHNVIPNRPSDSLIYPPGNFWPANSSAIGFVAYGTDNAALAPNSPYKNTASDGTDPGVNMSALSSATINTVNGITVFDTTPPTLTNISSNSVTTSSAVISWSTNESSDTQVEYGLTSSYGSVSALNTSPTQLHTVLFSSLLPNTVYHFRVKSRDANGNLAVSSNGTFTTTSDTTTSSTITNTTAPNFSATTQSQVAVPAGSRPIKRNIKNIFDSSKTCGTFQNNSVDYSDCLEYALNPQLSWVALDPVEIPTIATTTKTTIPPVVASKNQNTPVAQTKTLPRTVYFGQTHSDVVKLQDILKKLGYFPKTLKSSGYFGATTKKSVQTFQRVYGIASKGTESTTGYGMVGKITWKKLLEL